jgi:hypothetical protein
MRPKRRCTTSFVQRSGIRQPPRLPPCSSYVIYIGQGIMGGGSDGGSPWRPPGADTCHPHYVHAALQTHFMLHMCVPESVQKPTGGSTGRSLYNTQAPTHQQQPATPSQQPTPPAAPHAQLIQEARPELHARGRAQGSGGLCARPQQRVKQASVPLQQLFWAAAPQHPWRGIPTTTR